MIKCQDKKKCNWSNYVTDGWGLILDTFTYDHAGYIKSWSLVSKSLELEFTGETIPELLNILQNLKQSYNLKSEEHSKDILVIYTDDINKLYWFIKNYDVAIEIPHYFQVYDNIEFRPCWYDDLETAGEISEWAQYMIDNIFVPDKYYYITPNQIPRKRMKRARHKEKNTIAHDIYPKSFESFKLLRKAYFPGILFVPYPKKTIDDLIIEIDLKSAYIFCMLIEKHCMSESRKVNPEEWEYYLDSPTKASVGKYRIKYSSYTNKIKCFKNSNGEHCKKGEDIVDEFNLTDIDLKIMIDNLKIQSIECIYLYEYDLDYMPKYVRDELVYEYCKKEYIRKVNPDSEEDRIQKIIVNGEYGDGFRKWETKEQYKEDYKDPNLAPQWGAWTTSYCRQNLLSLGNKLKGWIYSATDSIYCLDIPENIKLIEEWNDNIRLRTKEFCDKFGYDYKELKDLGTFVIKKHIKKFKAFGPNSYLYTEVGKDRPTLKASGCPKEYRKNLTDEEINYLYSEDCEYIPAGKRTLNLPNPTLTECIVDGKKYTSNGSWYTRDFEGLSADLISLIHLKIRKNLM